MKSIIGLFVLSFGIVNYVFAQYENNDPPLRLSAFHTAAQNDAFVGLTLLDKDSLEFVITDYLNASSQFVILSDSEVLDTIYENNLSYVVVEGLESLRKQLNNKSFISKSEILKYVSIDKRKFHIKKNDVLTIKNIESIYTSKEFKFIVEFTNGIKGYYTSYDPVKDLIEIESLKNSDTFNKYEGNEVDINNNQSSDEYDDDRRYYIGSESQQRNVTYRNIKEVLSVGLHNQENKMIVADYCVNRDGIVTAVELDADLTTVVASESQKKGIVKGIYGYKFSSDQNGPAQSCGVIRIRIANMDSYLGRF